jgi:hypothetical protein
MLLVYCTQKLRQSLLQNQYRQKFRQTLFKLKKCLTVFQSETRSRDVSGYKYLPVRLFGFLRMSSGEPAATIVPPSAPASGPRSMI